MTMELTQSCDILRAYPRVFTVVVSALIILVVVSSDRVLIAVKAITRETRSSCRTLTNFLREQKAVP